MMASDSPARSLDEIDLSALRVEVVQKSHLQRLAWPRLDSCLGLKLVEV